jgi:estrone sulfotransferase
MSSHHEQLFAGDFVIRDDDVFLVSYPRSGNTWARFLLANLVHYNSGEPVDFHSVHQLVPEIELKAHREILRAMPSPRLIKSHSLYDPRFKRVIYILRDGRDVMVSFYCYRTGLGRFTGSFLDFLQKVDLQPCRWHEHVESWLGCAHPCDLLLIRYEDMLRHPPVELERIARFAGLPCDQERIAWATSRSTFDAMQKLEREKGREMAQAPGLEFVRRGIAGDWQAHFDVAHAKEFKSYANQTLLRWGYAGDEDW